MPDQRTTPRGARGYVVDLVTEPWRVGTHEECPSLMTIGGNHVTHVDDIETAIYLAAAHNAALHLAAALSLARR